jgi:CDP-diacylglycerol--glycerol-3-phosphate 3-phosphatidyltransferase
MNYFSKYKSIIPNYLTYFRMVIIPVFIACFYVKFWDANLLIAILFSVACITDYFDGYLSRKWNVQSKFGELLDPIADKLLVVTALAMLIHFDSAHIIPCIVIMCREIFISGLREFLAKINISVPVTKLAKYKTGIQMAAIIILLLGADLTIDGKSTHNFAYWLGNFCLWIAAILTVVTGYNYFKATIESNQI